MRVLITGASRGIGAGIARQLAADALQAGRVPHVALAASRESEELIALVDELRDQGANATVVTGDLADPATPSALVENALAFCGGLDAVVANAGIMSGGPLVTVEQADWDRLFAVNVRATWLLAKAAHTSLVESGGAMVAIASMSGMQPHTNNGAYSSSKAALIMLCQQLAQEWAADGVRVNSISPGMIHTSLTDRIYRNDDVAARRRQAIPMHRIGMPEDVAGVTAFLLSANAGYVTGQNIVVDGGFVSSIMGSIPGLPKPT